MSKSKTRITVVRWAEFTGGPGSSANSVNMAVMISELNILNLIDHPQIANYACFYSSLMALDRKGMSHC